MNQYGKHYRQCYTGSMRGAGAHVFALWGFCIANAEAPGRVELMPSYLAETFGCSEAEVEKAIIYLTSPDLKTRTEKEDGKRLVQIDRYVYRLVNWGHYHELNGDEDQRKYWRDKKAESRARNRKDGDHASQAVTAPSTAKPAAITSTAPPRCDGALECLQHLNRVAGRSFRETAMNLNLITARLTEVGNDVDGVKQMIDRQVLRWKGDPKMSEFLRPETLFGKQKFGGYYDTRDLPVEPAVNNPTGKPTFVRIQELEACIEVHPANRNWIGFVEEKATPEFREDLLAKRRELAGLRKGVQ